MCRKNQSRHGFVARSPPVAAMRPQVPCRRERLQQCACPKDCPAVSQRRRATSRRGSFVDINRCPTPESSLYSSVDCCCPPPTRTCCYPAGLRKPQRPQRPITQVAPKIPAPLPKRCPYPQPKGCHRGHQFSQPKSHPFGQPKGYPHAAPPPHVFNDRTDESNDSYYNYNRNPENFPISGMNPIPDFDLNRFERDQTIRRRNVSIRTCVDYDYEHGHPYQSPQMPPLRAHQPHITYQQPLPSCYSEFTPMQRNEYSHAPLEIFEDEDDSSTTTYVPCRYRRK